MHEEEIASLIRAEAGAVLADGRATLEVVPSHEERPATCELRPANEGACRLAVLIISDAQLVLNLGRYETVCELWCETRHELLSEAGEYLRAVLAGRYRELVRLFEGELVEAAGILKTEGAEIRIWSRRGPDGHVGNLPARSLPAAPASGNVP